MWHWYTTLCRQSNGETTWRIWNDVVALSGRKWRRIHCFSLSCVSTPPFALVFTPVPHSDFKINKFDMSGSSEVGPYMLVLLNHRSCESKGWKLRPTFLFENWYGAHCAKNTRCAHVIFVNFGFVYCLLHGDLGREKHKSKISLPILFKKKFYAVSSRSLQIVPHPSKKCHLCVSVVQPVAWLEILSAYITVPIHCTICMFFSDAVHLCFSAKCMKWASTMPHK
jgi:hypothetical protein